MTQSVRAHARLVLAGCMLVAGLTANLPAFAEDADRPILSFVLENDLFYNADRHYTNGGQFSWISPAGKSPYWLRRAARAVPFFPEGGKVRVSYALGQNMFTPRDIRQTDPPLEDRPYAGWLYGAVGLIAENGLELDQLQLSLGVVGPAAIGEDAQKFVHDITGADEPRGWDTQLDNEPAVQLTYQKSFRHWRKPNVPFFEFDVTPHIGGALGNVFIYANAGITFRLGHNLRLDYGPPRIQPGLPGSGYFQTQNGFGWYLFFGFDGRAVAHNMFLDGNTFEDSRHVEKRNLVGDLQAGIAITWNSVRLAYTHVFRTREFEGQDSADRFGAVSLSVAF